MFLMTLVIALGMTVFDDNVIDEYWDENESNEEAMNKTGMVMMMMTISTNLVFLV